MLAFLPDGLRSAKNAAKECLEEQEWPDRGSLGFGHFSFALGVKTLELEPEHNVCLKNHTHRQNGPRNGKPQRQLEPGQQQILSEIDNHREYSWEIVGIGLVDNRHERRMSRFGEQSDTWLSAGVSW